MTRHARVALMSTYYHPVLGGAEAAARRLAAFLVRRGHDVTVITTLTDAALPREETIDGARIERIGSPGPRASARKWTIIPRMASELSRRSGDYDVICVIDYRGVGLPAIFVGHRVGRRVAIQAQTEGVLSGSHLSALGRLVSWPARRAYTRADAVACISKGIQAEAIAAGVPAERVHYLPNTVDTDRFHPTERGERDRRRAELGWPVDRPLGIFVGRLSREKGIVDLLRAWQRVPAHATLAVVGPDMPGHPWDESVRAREVAASPSLAGRVIFHGATTDPAPLYRAADFAVVPSHWESFGLSAAEAMSSGLAVVASAVGGLTDYIVDGANGLLVPAQNPPALADAIVKLVNDPALRSRLAAAARDTVARFDERLVLERFGALLDQLAEVRS
ncbi:MAG TPA: glycosyltransferase family 4 protein [Vicinamibacterales bacterium]|jgi:glycosyltransferase involved in cell wall biosynthesis|nr:glycosyltransferase family 4 protein [Vicinamibacterales bacterium]